MLRKLKPNTNLETKIANSKHLLIEVISCLKRMLGKTLASSLLTFDSATQICFYSPDFSRVSPTIVQLNVNNSNGLLMNVVGRGWISHVYPKKRTIRSTAQIENLTLSDEDRKTWKACRQALSTFNFNVEEKDNMLGKAFGHVHSPYWGEERKTEVPNFEVVNEILDYLRSLSLSDDDIYKLLKKFPEVLGCSLEHELKTNVQILEKQWGIKGKTLRNLLLRNPKVLGYNVDCKGDCMAKCTRCWVRF
ncbi:mTERF domain-containing protein [Cephalotus follicularis]|uniref:mTERF domain-containing protein n=1 Tax=Cephalotus follicularis TaxID=3775 RepID=A0A1Q3AUE9_CEPFO|nr:mTERF domain-containing protein [Cephalotus follicularis]